MRVLVILDSLRLGGAEVLMVNLALHLRSRGVELIFCGLGEGDNLVSTLEKNDFSYYSFGVNDRVRFTIISQLITILRNDKIDLILSNHFRQLLHVFFPAVILRIPLIHIEHDCSTYLENGKYRRFLSWMSHKVNTLVTISDQLGDWYRDEARKLRCEVEVITNGIDTDRFKPLPQTEQHVKKERLEALGLPEDTFLLGACARLVPVKNIEYMLQLLAVLRKQGENCSLLVVGEGVQREKLEQMAVELELQDAVRLIGASSSVSEYLQIFDLYLLTSHDEGMPLAILEAIATGVPVFSHDVGNLAEVITDETGVLFSGLELDSWKEKITEYIGNRGANYSITDAERLERIQGYSLSDCVSKYYSVLHGAVHG